MNCIDQYVCLDARELNKIVVRSSVQTTITSPPYFGTKNYGENPLQIGWKQQFSNYLADLKRVFQQCYNATADTGTLWVVVDTYKRQGRLHLLPLELMELLEKIGWIPQDVVIWDKVKNLPYSSKGQFRNNFEYILLLSKTKDFKYYIDRVREIETLKEWWIKYPERYNPRGKVPENIWRIQIPSQGTWSNGHIQHLCPFPPELIERIILLSTDEDDLVLDPFAGSGVTLAQAKCMKRKFIGCDIYQEYVDRFNSVVLPEIERRWLTRAAVLRRKAIQQKEFSRLITSLRKLKYSFVLMKKLIAEFEINYFKLLVLEDTELNKDSNIPNEFTIFIAIDKLNKDTLKKWLMKQLSRRPLSKYELSPSIEVIGNNELLEHIEGRDCALYSDGKFYGKVAPTNINAVLSTYSGKFPPIISDIHISEKLNGEPI